MVVIDIFGGVRGDYLVKMTQTMAGHERSGTKQ